MRRARMEVAPHVVRQWKVLLHVRAGNAQRRARKPDFDTAVGLGNLRTGLGSSAAMQDAPGGMSAHLIRMIAPPDRTVRARIVELRHVTGLCKTNVETSQIACDARIHSVADYFAVFVVVE